jgi:methionyl-tRNA formyltransferase
MRIAFMGTPAFAVPSLDALAGAGHTIVCVVAQPDRPAGRGQGLRTPATKEWALARGIPVLQPEKVRDGTLCAALTALKPDVLVVAAYGRILGKDLLTLAPHGAINVHGSLLPRYRGAAPIQWAVANGDAETGVTVMQMDEGLDTGDMLLQRAMPIGPEDTAESLSPRLAELGGSALVEALTLLEVGRLTPVKQDPSEATLAPILSKEDGKVDWSLPATAIAARLRGFTPWPGAWTTLDGRTLKLLEVEPLPASGPAPTSGSAVGPAAGSAARLAGSPAADAPGSGTKLAGRGLAVACGDGTTLLVKRLQPEGKAAQEALAFLNGLRRDAIGLGT